MLPPNAPLPNIDLPIWIMLLPAGEQSLRSPLGKHPHHRNSYFIGADPWWPRPRDQIQDLDSMATTAAKPTPFLDPIRLPHHYPWQHQLVFSWRLLYVLWCPDQRLHLDPFIEVRRCHIFALFWGILLQIWLVLRITTESMPAIPTDSHSSSLQTWLLIPSQLNNE